ncbi:beta strand repeat-containing protein, partial [Polynucleobacter arcticus]
VTGVATTNSLTNTGNVGSTTLSTTGQATLNSATITNNATVGGTLAVTGAATTNGLTNTGNVETTTLETSGLATLRSAAIANNASVGGSLTVAGSATTIGLTNTGNVATTTLNTTGLATLRSATITNNATVGGNLTVVGKIVNNDNVVSIGQNAIQMVSGAVGSATGVNDRITTDGLAPGGPDIHLGGTVISSGGVVGSTPVNVQVDGTLVANKGITVGGAAGTSTVNFNNNRLQNVASATAGTDAVNLSQVNSLIATMGSSVSQAQVTGIQNQVNNLQNQVNQNNLAAQRGIAGVSAIAGIPAIEAGKDFSIGVGLGNYISASAISVGAQARVAKSTVVKISAGTTTYGGVVTSAGVGFSF